MSEAAPRQRSHTEPSEVEASPGRPYAGAQVDTDRQIVEVEVVPELCMQFLNCMRIATGAFRTDPATRKTTSAHWRQIEPARLWKAAWSCPSGAIRFVTRDGYVAPRWEEASLWSSQRHPAAGIRREAE